MGTIMERILIIWTVVLPTLVGVGYASRLSPMTSGDWYSYEDEIDEIKNRAERKPPGEDEIIGRFMEKEGSLCEQTMSEVFNIIGQVNSEAGCFSQLISTLTQGLLKMPRVCCRSLFVKWWKSNCHCVDAEEAPDY